MVRNARITPVVAASYRSPIPLRGSGVGPATANATVVPVYATARPRSARSPDSRSRRRSTAHARTRLSGVAATERDLTVRRPRADDRGVRLDRPVHGGVDRRTVGVRVGGVPADDADPFGAGADALDHVVCRTGRRI
jgi:hypothetical protein